MKGHRPCETVFQVQFLWRKKMGGSRIERGFSDDVRPSGRALRARHARLRARREDGGRKSSDDSRGGLLGENRKSVEKKVGRSREWRKETASGFRTCGSGLCDLPEQEANGNRSPSPKVSFAKERVLLRREERNEAREDLSIRKKSLRFQFLLRMKWGGNRIERRFSDDETDVFPGALARHESAACERSEHAASTDAGRESAGDSGRGLWKDFEVGRKERATKRLQESDMETDGGFRTRSRLMSPAGTKSGRKSTDVSRGLVHENVRFRPLSNESLVEKKGRRLRKNSFQSSFERGSNRWRK